LPGCRTDCDELRRAASPDNESAEPEHRVEDREGHHAVRIDGPAQAERQENRRHEHAIDDGREAIAVGAGADAEYIEVSEMAVSSG
jgi:hypothetical protein